MVFEIFLDKSKNLFNEEKERLIAILLALIIDEGYIDSTQISIGLKNELLIKDLDKMCSILGYESKVTLTKSEEQFSLWRLHILRKGMKRLYQDYLLLNQKYPVIDLGWKGERIKDSFLIFDRKIYKTKGNKELIFNLIKSESLSVNQLASRLNMTRQGIRFHIHNLLNEGKIRVISKMSPNWIYSLK